MEKKPRKPRVEVSEQEAQQYRELAKEGKSRLKDTLHPQGISTTPPTPRPGPFSLSLCASSQSDKPFSRKAAVLDTHSLCFFTVPLLFLGCVTQAFF